MFERLGPPDGKRGKQVLDAAAAAEEQFGCQIPSARKWYYAWCKQNLS
jgi:hypothetical protein